MRPAAKLLSNLAGLLLLSACSITPARPDDGMSWIENAGEDGPALLHYGPPDSDDLAATFSCRRGSGQVEVSDYGSVQDARRRTNTLTLAAGRHKITLTSRRSSNELFDEIVEAGLTATAPVLQEFQRTGAVTLSRDGAKSAYAATSDAERQAVRRFFAACLAA